MQQLSVQHIKQTLFSVMNSLFSRRDEFLSNPETAFTRKKKISFTQTMLFPMLAGSDNSATELLDLFDEEMLPLLSAMIQRRNQIKNFPMDKIKILYHTRWGEETAFRHLKYAGNMVHIHSLKKEFLIQEIYGKLTMYNFSSWLAAIVCPSGKYTEKYHYVVNHTQMQKICLRFLRGTIKDVAAMILRFLIPDRPGRSFKRCLRLQAADTLAYR